MADRQGARSKGRLAVCLCPFKNSGARRLRSVSVRQGQRRGGTSRHVLRVHRRQRAPGSTCPWYGSAGTGAPCSRWFAVATLASSTRATIGSRPLFACRTAGEKVRSAQTFPIFRVCCVPGALARCLAPLRHTCRPVTPRRAGCCSDHICCLPACPGNQHNRTRGGSPARSVGRGRPGGHRPSRSA